MEHKLIYKGGVYGRDYNSDKMFAYLLHLWCDNPVAILSLCIIYNAYHVVFQLVKYFLSMDITVVLVVYMN